MTEIQDFSQQVLDNVERVIIGKRDLLELMMVALLCEGHVLVEDVPGTGKTMLARAFALSLNVDFKRLQCTPDLLPNDVTGVSVYQPQTQTFALSPGQRSPTFCLPTKSTAPRRARSRPCSKRWGNGR